MKIMLFKRQIILLLFFIAYANAADYYIIPSGNDANPCSLASPCLTFTRANTLATSGDIVHVLSGTYTQSHITTTKSGVTWLSDPIGAAKIVTTATDYAWQGTGDGVIYDGFEMTGTASYGIRHTSGANPTMQHMNVHNLTGPCTSFGGAGLYIGDYPNTGGIIRYNLVHDIQDGTKNTVACNTNHGIYATHAFVSIHNNISYNNWSWGIHIAHGGTDDTIAHNLVWGNGRGGITIAGDTGDGPGINCRTKVINNITMNNGASWSTTGTMREYSNVGSGTDKNIFANNLFFANKNTDYNMINATPTGTVDADPRLANFQLDGSGEYHLTNSSPAINAGTAVGGVITPDRDGVIRPQGAQVDIGPSEFIIPGTSTNYPKVSQTTKTLQTANNTSTPSWPEGAAPTWTGCSGYHCLITTKGLTACDGTTAAPTFCETTVPRPANVSGVDDGVSLRDLLYPGATTHIQTHYQGWFCPTGTRCNGHINLGVASNTTAQVTKELQEMHDVGIRGVQHYWQGRPYGTASFPSVCAANNQMNKCYLDESTQKVRDAIENTPAFQDMDYSIVYSTEANTDCDANPNPTNCGDGTAQSCALVDDLPGIDDRHQHCSNALSTECTTNAGCPTGGSCIYNGCTSNDKAVVDLNWLQDNLFTHPRYQKDAGRPVVYLFGFSNSGQDWAGIRAALTSNPKIISRFNNGSNPMTESNFDGGWGWQGRPSSDCYGYTTTFAGGSAESTGCGSETCNAHGTDIYACAATKAQAAPGKFYAEGLHSQHDNRSTPWAAPNGGSAPTKINPPFCGNTLLKAYSVLNSKWSSANQVDFATQVTWDDVDESSAVKAGIESCWRFQAGSPYLAGNVLNWVIEKYDTDGSGPQVPSDATLATLDHFRLFISGAGITPAAYSGDALYPAVNIDAASGNCSVTTCAYSYDLSALGLNGGLQYVSLKLVGKALIQTKYSPVVYYIGTGGNPAPNNPPLVTLSLNPISGTVPILTTGTLSATDSDGTISLATLNWGDGTIDTVTGLTTKTHTYNASGVYTVTYSATDNLGSISNTTKTFTASDPTPPPTNIPPVVTLSLSPTSGTIPAATTATISATDSDGTISSATINWGDGTAIDTVTGLGTKGHTFTVNGAYTVTYSATDNSGGSSSITAPFTAAASPPPANIPPVVTMTLSPVSGIVPILTTATLTATDSDGTVTSTSVNWGDGTTDVTTGLGSKAHTYITPGAYTVIYSATDNSGDSSTVTKPFTASPATFRRHRPREN